LLVSWLGQATEMSYAKDTRPVFGRGKGGKRSMVSILDVIFSSSTSGHHMNITEITAEVPRSRNVHEEYFSKRPNVSKRKCRDNVNKHRGEVSCSRRLRKQARKCRDHVKTEIDRTTTEINAKCSRSSEYIWRILFNIITETKMTISRSAEYSRRILFKIITKSTRKLLHHVDIGEASCSRRIRKWTRKWYHVDITQIYCSRWIRKSTWKWYHVDISEISCSRWIRKSTRK
jgi:hypothetical protein